MKLVGIFAVVLLFVAVLVLYIRKSYRRKNRNKRQRAAERLVNEELLEEKISLRPGKNGSLKRKMIQLSWKENGVHNYVLDPENGIRIGRSPQGNDVIVDYAKVSASHCIIFLYQNKLYVKDLRSSNGTRLIRQGHTYVLNDTADLKRGDILDLGGVRFKIRPFWFDASRI